MRKKIEKVVILREKIIMIFSSMKLTLLLHDNQQPFYQAEKILSPVNESRGPTLKAVFPLKNSPSSERHSQGDDWCDGQTRGAGGPQWKASPLPQSCAPLGMWLAKLRKIPLSQRNKSTSRSPSLAI